MPVHLSWGGAYANVPLWGTRRKTESVGEEEREALGGRERGEKFNLHN